MNQPNSMKRLAVAIAMACTISSLAACQSLPNNPGSSPAAKVQDAANHNQVFPNAYQLTELDNGLKVLIVKTNHPGVVSLQIPVSTGSRNEVEEGKTGFAHFFEHMMFKGTPNFPQEKYDSILKNAGVDNRAYTTDDYTNYHLNFAKEHLQTMLQLEADRFQHLTYTEAQFRTEALTVKGEYLKNSANPTRKLLEAAQETAFDKHTYKHTTMGFFKDIEAMPDQMAYAKVFFERFYKPQNVTLVITGDVDPAATLAWVKQYWGGWQRGDYQAQIPVEPKQMAPRYRHVEFAGMPGHYVMVSFKGAAFDPSRKDKPALDLLYELNFGENSALYQKLVVEQQIASEMFSYLPDRKDPSLMHVVVKVDKPEDAAMVRDEIAKTMVSAQFTAVDGKALAALKANLKYSFANRLDSAQAIADTLARYVHFNRDPAVINQLYQTFDGITAADLMAVAKQYWQDSQRTTITMSAQASLPGFTQEVQLAEFAKAYQAAPAPRFKVVDKRNDSPLIDVSLLFNTGAAAEPNGQRGVAALMANMLANGGSSTMSYKEVQQALYPLAASFQAQLDKEMLVFRGRVHQDNAQAWYDVIRQQLLQPGWREDDFARVKKDLINGIKVGLKTANDEELAKEVLYSELYRGHPYQSYNLGDLSDLEALTLADVKAFYQQQLTQAKLTLGVTGAMPDALLSQMQRDLTGLAVGSQAKLQIAAAPTLTGKHATIIEKNASSTAVSFGFPIATNRSSADWTALWLVRSYLGEHRSSNSHLYQRIRQIRGMNYGDYAYIEYFPRGMFQTKPDANLARSSQIFQVWLRPLRDNNDAHFATRTALFELQKLIAQGMSEADFVATKNFLYNFVPQLVASQDRYLGYVLDSEFYGTGDFVAMVRNKLDSLTLADVNRVIKANLQTDNMHYVFVTGNGNDMAMRIASEQASPMTYNAQKPEALVAEDTQIAVLPLAVPEQNIRVLPIDSVFQ